MISFMSDWGYVNYYVGVAKSVIKMINPSSEVIDLTHGIEPFNVRMAAYMLERAVEDFPKGTVFLVVVDQGVGTERHPIAMETKNNYYFVGPDNGVFTRVIKRFGLKKAVVLENKKYYYKKSASFTFHGRDIFAPAAAYIDKGVDIEKFGREISRLVLFEDEEPVVENSKIKGALAYYDGFGNLETNIPSYFMGRIGKKFGDMVNVNIGGKILRVAYVKAFGDVNTGDFLIHEDSSGYLEISVNQGSAKEVIKKPQGSDVEIW